MSTREPGNAAADVATEVSPPLEYVQRPPLPFVGRHRKKLVSLALLLAIAILLYRYWQPLEHRVLWVYWSRAAAAHVMPASSTDLILSDPAAISKALASDPNYFRYAVPGTTASPVAYWPTAYRELVKYDSRLGASMMGDAVTFVGTMRRPDGTPRLVIVTGCSGYNQMLLNWISVRVLPIPSWFDSPPTLKLPTPSWVRSIDGPIPIPTRLKSGMRDPADASHIVFEFEKSSAPFVSAPWKVDATGVIDAHLQNDDSITFTLRSFSGNDLNLHLGHDLFEGDPQVLQTRATNPFQPLGSRDRTVRSAR
jgi:hypothetical protein